MLRYFVSRSSVGTFVVELAPAGRRPSRHASTPRRSADAAASGSSSSSHVRGAATVGCSRPRSEYGAIVVFDPLFWLQSRNTLPARRLLVMVAVTSFGMACSSCCATRLANTTAPRELTGSSSGAYRCRPLLPLVSGYVVRPMSSIRSLTARATSHSCFIVTPSPGSRSNTKRVAGPGYRSPTNRHCGTWTSSAACWAIQASASTVSMIG